MGEPCVNEENATRKLLQVMDVIGLHLGYNL